MWALLLILKAKRVYFSGRRNTKRIRYGAIDFLLKLYKIYVFQYFVMST